MTDLRRAVLAAQTALRVSAAAVPVREGTWVSPPRTVREWLHRIGRPERARQAGA